MGRRRGGLAFVLTRCLSSSAHQPSSYSSSLSARDEVMRHVPLLSCLLAVLLLAGCNSAPSTESETDSQTDTSVSSTESDQAGSEHSGEVVHADAATFEATVLQSDQPVLVDFWAEWCGPCLALAPVIDEIAKEYGGKARVVKVDVDNAQELAQQYQVEAIPTMIVFRDGQEFKRVVGNVPKGEITSAIDSAL